MQKLRFHKRARAISARQGSGDQNESEFAAALEKGFRAANWKGALAKGIEARRAQRNGVYASAFEIARLYAALGEADQAFQWINIAHQERDRGLLFLKTDFLFDPLRSDPRFAELSAKSWAAVVGRAVRDLRRARSLSTLLPLLIFPGTKQLLKASVHPMRDFLF